MLVIKKKVFVVWASLKERTVKKKKTSYFLGQYKCRDKTYPPFGPRPNKTNKNTLREEEKRKITST